MALKEEMRDYIARYAEVEKIVQEERRSASFELRWKQLNAAYALGVGLGFPREDLSEFGVFERWAMIKEKAESQSTKG